MDPRWGGISPEAGNCPYCRGGKKKKIFLKKDIYLLGSGLSRFPRAVGRTGWEGGRVGGSGEAASYSSYSSSIWLCAY